MTLRKNERKADMMNTEEIKQEFRQICQKLGWKMTSSRLAVYSYVRGNGTHPSVNMVWEAVRKSQPAISRESIHRILCDFAQNKLIYHITDLGVSRYDSDIRRHDHFVCDSCGDILDAELAEIPGCLPEIPEDSGTVTHWEIRLHGICRKCIQNQKRIITSSV